MNLTVEKTMATMSNVADENHDYIVRGEVYSDGGEYEAIHNGQVLGHDGTNYAWFNSGITEPLSINFGSTEITAAEQSVIMTAILDFIAAASKGNRAVN